MREAWRRLGGLRRCDQCALVWVALMALGVLVQVYYRSGIERSSNRLREYVRTHPDGSIEDFVAKSRLTLETSLSPGDGWELPEEWAHWTITVAHPPPAPEPTRTPSPDTLAAQYLVLRPTPFGPVEYYFVAVDDETGLVAAIDASDYYSGWIGLEMPCCFGAFVLPFVVVVALYSMGWGRSRREPAAACGTR